MLSPYQRAQVGHVSLLIQIELAENSEPENLLEAILLAMEEQDPLEGNA